MSSVAESVPKHETVHEVTRSTPRCSEGSDDGRGFEASTETAHETMKDADITTETGEYEGASKVGVEEASTPIAAPTHESKEDA